jgi:endogenous inhibitor of DNA gyrase (YacG/DUF329 family)
MDLQQNAAEVKCTYCGKPAETPVRAKIIDQAYDNVRRKKYVRTRELEFCSKACASYYQMGCEG